MARLRALPDQLRQATADRLARFLAEGPVRFGEEAGPELQLHESFPIVSLRDDVSLDGAADLRDALFDTGAQLHRIVRGSRAIAFSISHLEADARPVIDQYSESLEAEAISLAIEAVDRADISNAYEASILDLRAVHLAVIVLIGDGSLPTLVVPFRVPSFGPLRRFEVSTSRAFIDAYREAQGRGGLRPGNTQALG